MISRPAISRAISETLFLIAVGVDGPTASSARIGLSETKTGAVHVPHYPHWHRHVQGRLHAALRRRHRPGSTTNQPPPRANGPLLQEASPHRDRHGGLRKFPSLGSGTQRPWPHRAADPAAICEALREARQERPQRRRGDL